MSDHATENEVPFVAVVNGEKPPWGDDLTCPECGKPDLPLIDSEPPGLTAISHCGKTWLRGPIRLRLSPGGGS